MFVRWCWRREQVREPIGGISLCLIWLAGIDGKCNNTTGKKYFTVLVIVHGYYAHLTKIFEEYSIFDLLKIIFDQAKRVIDDLQNSIIGNTQRRLQYGPFLVAVTNYHSGLRLISR